MPLAESVRVAQATSPLPEPVRLALDCLPDPSLALDDADKVVFANTAFTRMTGLRTPDVEGLGLGDLTEQGAPAGMVLFRRMGGGPIPAAMVVRPMAGELANGFRLARLEQDETRRTLMEELSAGLDVRGEFMARVSHELRTPLTAMQEGLDVVLEGLTGPLNARQIEFLQLARRNVQRLSRLVQDTLNLADLKRSGPSRSFRPANLDGLLADCAAKYEQVEYRPGSIVWAEIDERQIREALDRLVQNAIRHTGSPVCLALRAQAGEAMIAVADSGPGIPHDKLDAIFDEYEQLSKGPGRTVGGVGLGLPIVKLIVERHGGRVWAKSELGRGSIFYFTLKTCPAPVENTHDNREPS